MKIAGKLYVGLLLLGIVGSSVGCGSRANKKIEMSETNKEAEEQGVIAPHVFYLSGDAKLYKLDIETGQQLIVEENVKKWEVVGDKIYYTTEFMHKEGFTEEDGILSQNELYVMDLDGNNKVKLMGKDEIKDPQEIPIKYLLLYNLLGQDDQYVYFAMEKAIGGLVPGYNVVYRINVETNQMEQVSDVIGGPIDEFTSVNNRFYFTSVETGGQWGYITAVDCLTRETTLLTECGRIAGSDEEDFYYVDMKDYMKAKVYEEMRQYHIQCNPFSKNNCVRVTKENYKEIAEKSYADPILYKVDATGKVEQDCNMHFMDQVISVEENYYTVDLDIKDGCLKIQLVVYDMKGESTASVEYTNLGEGASSCPEEYGSLQGKIVLGQTKDKLYYLERNEMSANYDLFCVDRGLLTREMLETEIYTYTCDATRQHIEQLSENLMATLVKLQGERY